MKVRKICKYVLNENEDIVNFLKWKVKRDGSTAACKDEIDMDLYYL